MRLSCPSCAHSFALKTSLITGTPRRVRCPACADTLVARRLESGAYQVQTLTTIPEGPPSEMPSGTPGGTPSETPSETSSEVPSAQADAPTVAARPTARAVDDDPPPPTQLVHAAADDEEVTGMIEPPAGFGDDIRGRKPTVMEGPSDRENISGMHELEVFTSDEAIAAPSAAAPDDLPDAPPEGQAGDIGAAPPLPADAAPAPRAALSGPRVVLGAAVRSRVAVHNNATSVMETVRDLEAVKPATSLFPLTPAEPLAPGLAPADAPVRVSPTWSPAVDTEVTHEPSRVARLPTRTLFWGAGVAFVLAILLAGGVVAWFWISGAAPPFAGVPSPAAGHAVAEPAPPERGEQGDERGEAGAPPTAPPATAGAPAAEAGARAPAAGTPGGEAGAPAAEAGAPAAEAAAGAPAAGAEAGTPAAEAGVAPEEGRAAPAAAAARRDDAPAPPSERADEPEVVVPTPAAPRDAPAEQPVRRAASHEVFDTAADTSAPWLALRSRAHRRSRLVAEMPDDTAVRVLARRGKWWKVRIVGGEDDGLEGWAHKRWIRRLAR